ncbi:MAG: hypothetical protein WBL50_11665 [Candidatus Acidiferrum sp.]
MQVYELNRFRSFERVAVAWFCTMLLSCAGLTAGVLAAQAPAAQRTPPAVGTIKSISGEILTLATDSNGELKVQLAPEVKVLRVPPGSKDLKAATPIQLGDLQPGDRILVRVKPGADASTPVAIMIVAMTKSDIAVKQQKDREEWQRHGIGGLVSGVDPAQNTVTIKTMTAAGSKEVVVHAGQTTILRRYAPGSVNFDEATVAPITEIHTGDQLRARGARSADGGEFNADEIVSGSFRNIAGMVTGVNAAAGTLTLTDLATKKPVELKVTPDSQMRKLPQEMVQRIAVRLKGAGAAPGAGVSGGAKPADGQPGGTPPANANANAGQGAASNSGGPGMGGAQRGGGSGDLQQMLTRLPASPLNEFQKGDVVMVVATSGQGDGPSTVITLLGGVEPILQATSQGQVASILSPWSLSQGGGGEMGTQ